MEVCVCVWVWVGRMWNGSLGLDHSILCVSVMEICKITGPVSIVPGSQPPQISLHEHFILLLYPKVPSNLLVFASFTQVIGNIFFFWPFRLDIDIKSICIPTLCYYTRWPCQIQFGRVTVEVLYNSDYIAEVGRALWKVSLRCSWWPVTTSWGQKLMLNTHDNWNDSVRGQTFIEGRFCVNMQWKLFHTVKKVPIKFPQFHVLYNQIKYIPK